MRVRLSKRLKSEIDYVVKGIDEDKEIVVASRKEAMDRKCKEFLLETDKDGNYIVYEGAVVEARVVCTFFFYLHLYLLLIFHL